MEQKAKEAASHAAIPVSISAMLVTLGVVYGDIGTSPMYVTKALVAGNGGIGSVTEEFVLGALSLVVWTVTLLTTIKYVLISLRADNHGEGGIFALYSLVKRCGKWLIIPAMLGGAALLADGILTPAVTVTTAIEGLRTIPAVHAVLGDDQGRVVAITLAIIIVLFLVQRIGTAKIGHAFGPIMTLWFLFLGGNDQESLSYISKMTGKATIDTITRGETKGRGGSSSRNFQNTGRELVTPEELRMVDRDALLLIRGECPVMDRKYDLNRHPNIRYTEMGGAPPYKVPEDYCALSASIPAEDVQEEWKKGTPLAPELLSAFEVLHSKEELEEKKIERKKEQA
ncbi:MAG: hypothetical protein EGS37_01085 [Ruthenibacterium lactatiformans]|nr:hypothetical protein [Ruthenibacterium lactatiformans]